jgi:hypothetical protein
MAIVTFNSPSGKQSVQDSLWYAAASDASGLTNFKYVFDVYNGAGDQLIRAKVYPDVNDGWGYFDAGSVVRNEVSFEWFKIGSGSVVEYGLGANENEVGITVKVGEEYNVGASGIINLDLDNDTTTAYNYFPSLWNRRQIDIDDYYQKFYTNRPLYGTTAWGEDFVIGYYRSGTVTIEVKKYSDSGTLLSTNSKSKNLGTANFKILNMGMEAINAEFASSIFSASDTDGYYTFKIEDNVFRLNIKCIRDYPPVNLYFMNAFGVFDTARFDCTNKLAMTANRKKYERKDVTFSGGDASYYTTSGGSYKNKYNETTVAYAQDLSWSYKLMMNYPTDAEWEWLVELIHSPQIYMDIDGQLYPVTIKTSNYEYNKQVWAKLKTFDIEVEVNQKRQGFRR